MDAVLNLPRETLYYSRILWHGDSESQALDYVLSLTVEELAEASLGSIALARKTFEELLLGEKIPDGIFYGIDKDWREFCSRRGKKAFCDIDSAELGDRVMLCLEAIHDRWVRDNSAKYKRDDSRLFQHLPFVFLGEREMAKDLFFLKALADAFALDLGDYGNPERPFIPAVWIVEAFYRRVSRYKEEYGIFGDKALYAHLEGVVLSYEAISEGYLGKSRFEYMRAPDRISLLAESVARENSAFCFMTD